MEYLLLPGTELIASRIAFGAEPLGGTDWGEVDVPRALAAVSAALDLGINLFDTADVYGLGRSETLLSQALGARRHDVVIVTKFGVNWQVDLAGNRARTFLDSSPKRVVEALEGSLRRLRVDCIPIYLLHRPDPNTPLSETVAALHRCREAGKVRYVGLSNFAPAQIRQAMQLTDLAAIEFPHNLLQRVDYRECLLLGKELGIGTLVYGALAQGLLSGKYSTDAAFPRGDRRQRLSHFQGVQLARNLQTVERLKQVARDRNKHPSQVAICWVLEQPGVSCAIVGAKTPEQVEINAGAVGWRLTQAEQNFLETGEHEGAG